MRRARIRELALIAVAGGLLAFEAISLHGVLPTAKAFVDRSMVHEVKAASLDAAFTPAPVLADAGSAAAYAATRAAKGAARLLGTVTAPPPAFRSVLVVTHEGGHSGPARVQTVSMTAEACRQVGSTCRSTRRAREARRAVETTVRRTTL